MSRTYFDEIQTVRENPWILVLMAVSTLAAIIPLGSGVYWQLVKGEPWGDKPLSDEGLVSLFVFIVLVCLLSIFMILTIKLEVKIDDLGIHYRFRPIKWRWQLIAKEEIETFTLEDKFKFFEAPGFGYHRNRLKRTWSFRITGSRHIRVVLRNGRKFLFGTQNGEEFHRALKKITLTTREIS
jgi:hypothetical protein